MQFPAATCNAVRVDRRWLALVGLLVGAVFAFAASAAQAAEEFGVAPYSFVSGACNNNPLEGECKVPATQAGSHPVFSVSKFTMKTVEEKGEIPLGTVKRVRIDSPPGFITNPNAVPTCTDEQLTKEKKAGENECPAGSQMGFTAIKIFNPFSKKAETLGPLPMYNMVPPQGSPADFAYYIPLTKEVVNLVGGVSWHQETKGVKGVPTGDSHEYYTISGGEVPLIESTTIFLSAPNSTFLTVPTSCTGPSTTYLELESGAGQVANTSFTPVPPLTPVPLETTGCNLVPFEPSLTLTPERTQSDVPTAATVEIKVPQNPSPEALASAHLRNSSVTLPEGMTLNPSAAHGLEGCTAEQVGIAKGVATEKKVECPAGSIIGTAVVESSAILPPEGSTGEGMLTGNIYLGKPANEAITKPPYTIYVVAESERYGLGLRLEGTVEPNPLTGQLTATFKENPQEPFNALKLTFKGGSLAPLANPLNCGAASASASLTPWSGNPASALSSAPFTVDSNGSGGACASPLPFSLTQSTQNQSGVAGALTSYTFTLSRNEGQQYLSQVKTTLPPGLLGPIPAVTLCGEAEANAGTCSAASQIGSAAVLAGSGPTPYPFSGPVYLTGPYNGAPYGLSIVVPANAGPFSLGNVVTRATINVDPNTARLIVTATLPRVVGGIPLRIRGLAVSINRQSFLFNPTSCAALSTESALNGFVTPGTAAGASQSISTPFQVGECSKLPFSPKLGATTGARHSRANGASIEVKISQGAKQMNLRKVLMTLPKQLPVRGSTLKKACPAAQFEDGPAPGTCPSTARVGGIKVTTPVLPGTLEGPAYLVSHGGQAFPDLDLIVRGDGVQVVLVGHSYVSSKGIISSKFETLPDVPVTSATVNLPVGPQSLLAGNGNLCTANLVATTNIYGQNGRGSHQKTKIAVRNCPVQIVKHHTYGTYARVTAQAPAAGHVSASGGDLRYTKRNLKKAGKVTFDVPLTSRGVEALRRYGVLRLKLRVGFVPKTGHATSKAFAKLVFHY
ncbi:MAG TPA: hypothetical protein VMU32_03110 [Solirubrobacteraceae bacterium]|nr:hypothetical protein [Solirubrobacteraceae bacterium]